MYNKTIKLCEGVRTCGVDRRGLFVTSKARA